jgi:hypothetical protein
MPRFYGRCNALKKQHSLKSVLEKFEPGALLEGERFDRQSLDNTTTEVGGRSLVDHHERHL